MKEEYPHNPREIALRVLYDIEINKAYSNLSLKYHLGRQHLAQRDRSLVTHLVYGTIKNKTRIDWIIANYSHTPIRKMTPWVHNILRLGIYQILYLDRVPNSAAVNESVKLAKKYGHKKIAGFINAVLRNIARTKGKSLS